jgi:hypothetical protein
MFRYLSSFIDGLSTFYSLFGFGFVLMGFTWRGLRVILINLVILNVFVYCSLKINVDEYSKPEGNGYYDPIIEEFREIFSNLMYVDARPALRVSLVKKGHIFTYISTIDDENSDSTFFDPKADSLYRKGIADNIEYLKSVENSIKFTRNRHAAARYLAYLNAVNTELQFEFQDTTELYATKDLKMLNEYSRKGFKGYAAIINNDDILDGQNSFRDYNNSIFLNSENSVYMSKLPYLILQYPGAYLAGQYKDDLNLRDNNSIKPDHGDPQNLQSLDTAEVNGKKYYHYKID